MGTVAANTRERLLAAARQVIEEGGYGAASVLAIADRAGVAAGTLYRHFASKEELFVEVFRSVCEREERAMRTAADQLPEDATARERLETVLATFARRALRNPRLAWAVEIGFAMPVYGERAVVQCAGKGQGGSECIAGLSSRSSRHACSRRCRCRRKPSRSG